MGGKPKNNLHCESLIDEDIEYDECAKFLLVVRTWIYWQPGGKYDDMAGIPIVKSEWWDLEPWNDDLKREFKTNFRDRIQEGFGYGKFWLRHHKKKHLWCDVWIDYVKDPGNAHLLVRVVNNPTLPKGTTGRSSYFRSECRQGGETPLEAAIAAAYGLKFLTVDMTIARDRATKAKTSTHWTSDKGDQQFKQSTVQHEFGHYLGLGHRCETWNPLTQSDKEAYCEAGTFEQQDDLMARGNAFHSEHGKPFALRACQKHGYDWPVDYYLATNGKKRPWKSTSTHKPIAEGRRKSWWEL